MIVRVLGFASLLVGLALAGCQSADPPSAPDARDVSPEAAATDAATGAWPTFLPDGQPDIQGLWHYVGGSHGLNLEELPHPAYPGGVSPTLIVDPPGAILPFHPWARARRDEVLRNYLTPNQAQVDPQSRGWPDGVPRLNYYSHLIQILQPPGYIVLLYEVQHEFRVIPLDGRPHAGSDITLWMGDSRGRWEDDTLVVDVTNHNDSTRFAVTGEFHSDAMRLTERWTLVDRDTIEYRATVDDPQVYTGPWTLGITIKRDMGGPFAVGGEQLDGNEILEYAGVEGERDVEMVIEDEPGPD